MSGEQFSCPNWLDKRAQSEWRRVVTVLSKVPMTVDRTALISYCQAYARLCKAEERLEEEGKTVTIIGKDGVSVEHPSPWVRISKIYRAIMMKAALKLGIIPPRTDAK